LADVLIHVIDRSNPSYLTQIEAVNEVLHELKIDNKPIILAYNKLDKVTEPFSISENGVAVSVTTGLNMDRLVELIEKNLP
jgi:GTP-binding protein HflX